MDHESLEAYITAAAAHRIHDVVSLLERLAGSQTFDF